MPKQVVVWVVAILSMVAACGPDTIFVRPYLDSASQHIANGNSLLAYGKVDDACREFARARELDPQNALALAGMGMAMVRKGDLKKALDNLDRAKAMAVDSQDFAVIQEGYEQYYEALRIRQGDP